MKLHDLRLFVVVWMMGVVPFGTAQQNLAPNPAPANAARIHVFSAESGPASGSESQEPGLMRPFVRVGKANAQPKLDGLCDEPMWENALALGPLLNLSGNAFPEESTSVRLLWDEAMLYIGVRCEEALLDPVLQRTHEVRADTVAPDGNVFRDDCVELFLQPSTAEGRYFHLALNPRGTLYDASCRAGVFDTAWRSNTIVATQSDLRAWTAEVAIPLAALGGTPDDGARWRFNVGRHRAANDEYSAWAPTGNGFHNPDAFGTIAFADRVPGLRTSALPSFEEGARTWRMEHCTKDSLAGVVLARYENGPWLSFPANLPASPDVFSPAAMPYVLSRHNRCILLDVPAEKRDRTVCFRTDRLPVKAGALYHFSAMVRATDLTTGGRPLAFSISSYEEDGKAIKTYETVVDVPCGAYGWRPVYGQWQAPDNAAGILFWVVKWANSGVTGTVWLDDMRLSEAGQARNVIPNGGIDPDADGKTAGWPVQHGTFADSYARGRTVTMVCRLFTPDGTLLYSSTPLAGELTEEVTAIGTSLLLIPAKKDADNRHRIKELHVNEGSYLHLPLVLRSSLIATLSGCDVVVDVPEWLRLVSPAPRIQLISRETTPARSGFRTRYRLRFSRDALTPAEADRHTTCVNSLVFVCGAVPPGAESGDEATHAITFHGEVTTFVEEPTHVPLHVHPPLQWKRPRTALIKHWACSSFYRPFRQLNPGEQDAIARTWRQAGFNRSGAALDQELRDRYGFSARGHIPLINAPGSLFPGGSEYLSEHPEARALTFAGEVKASAFCPTYFLSAENAHLREVRGWLAKEAKHYPHLDWDYEVPVLRDSSLCVCDRCLQRFRDVARLPDDAEVTRDNVRGVHRKEWVDFRCRENARIAMLFREAIKQADSSCLFSVYSGYQGKTDEKYGVDWRYMAQAADLVWAGYGRPVQGIADTHTAIDGRPFIAGTLAWYGAHPWNNALAQVGFLRRISDGGSGIMAYFNWIVDGRFYQAISRVSSIVADFERFFRWDVDEGGICHSRYRRDDSLVRVGGEGEVDDVTVLVHGDERLIFVFNAGKLERTFEIEHLQWREGMVCVDAESKERLGGSQKLVLPAAEARVFHVSSRQAPVAVAPPLVLSSSSGSPVLDPILAWQGQGDQPGNQVFSVELSADPTFPRASTTVFSDRSSTALMPLGLEPGRFYAWRVRGTDVVTGEQGPWSTTTVLTTAVFAAAPTGVPAFSPNGDGVLDTFELTAALCGDVAWRGEITGLDGQPVKSLQGKGREVKLPWDGTDSTGAAVAQGTYRCTIAPVGFPELAASTTVEVNLKVGLINPGFAPCQGFILSVPGGKAALSKDYAMTWSDTYAMRFEAPSDETTCYWSNYSAGGIGTNVIPVTPGQSYRLSARVRVELERGAATIAFAFFTSTGRWAQVPGHPPWGVASDETTARTDWEKRELVLIAPEDAHSAVLFLKLEKANGVAWFDDLVFEEVQNGE